MSKTSRELLPLLVADLADAESIDLVRRAAADREVVFVPLLAAPVDRRRHLLEAFYGDVSTPERFFAVPSGAPSSMGFPLRLSPYVEGERGSQPEVDERDDDDDTPTIERKAPVVRGRTGGTSPSMTKRHTRDLAEGEDHFAPGGEHAGRLLASGKYRLDELVGAGGMGAVYRGHHRDLDRVVAVKVLHPHLKLDGDLAKRFHAEAQTMSRIDNPNVTRVLDFGQEPDGLVYIAMEYLDGIDLESVIEREGRLPLDRLLRIMVQVCGALGHVHRHGIIHRDVKPTNIMLVAGHNEEDDTPTEVVKVCDFGIALAYGSTTRVAGTPEYMSPEQVKGSEIDARSDIYACGVLLYELATGQLPFSGDAAEVLRKQLMDPPPPPSLVTPDIDPLLESIIMRALSKNIGDRQPTMRHLRAELKELLAPVFTEAGGPVSAGPDSSSFISISPKESSPPPPPVSVRPAGRSASSAERWFGEDGEGQVGITTLASLVERDPNFHEGDELADELMRDPETRLLPLLAMRDAAQFVAATKPLEQAVRKLLKQSAIESLARVVQAMRAVMKEERESGLGMSERMKAAGRVLRILRDPPRLAGLVDIALAAPEEPSAAVRYLLFETQEAGAAALLTGRQDRHGALAQSRLRYIALTRSIGPAAVAIVRSALYDAIKRGERDSAFVEDLIRAIPPVPDETTGSVVAEVLRDSPPATMAASLIALATLWGERARPLMLGALSTDENVVQEAALVALRHAGGVDPIVVRHIDRILSGAMRASESLIVAAATVLADALPPARPAASALLMRSFARGAMHSGVSPAVIVAMARSMLALGVPNASSLIEEQATRSGEPLRNHLLALMASRG